MKHLRKVWRSCTRDSMEADESYFDLFQCQTTGSDTAAMETQSWWLTVAGVLSLAVGSHVFGVDVDANGYIAYCPCMGKNRC